jgi:hypothetical protein
MKTLITKADGSAVKSKIHAVKFLEKIGIDKSELIEENGQFYYEAKAETPAEAPTPKLGKLPIIVEKPVTWETEVFDKNNERTKLYIPNTDVTAVILGKHPAGQNRAKSAFEVSIGDENFVMSVDLLSKIFKVRG